MRRVLAALPDVGSRATDLGRALDLNSALAWQIHRLANQPEHLISASVVPKAGAMERFIVAASKHVAPELIQNVRHAYETLEKVVAQHAGDRETFDAMLTLRGSEDAAGLRRLRRAAHRANSALMGVSCRCMIHTVILNEAPGGLDSLTVLGHVGMQRLHAGAVYIPAGSYVWNDSKVAENVSHSSELIEEACSRPLPRIEREQTLDGSYRELLQIEGLGKQTETTVFWRNRSIAPGEITFPPIDANTSCKMPAELFLYDILFPKRWMTDQLRAEAWLTPMADRFITAESSKRHRLPFEGSGQYLGASSSALHSAAAKQYADLIESEIGRVGWTDVEFAIFRCEVQYPILNSEIYLCIG